MKLRTATVWGLGLFCAALLVIGATYVADFGTSYDRANKVQADSTVEQGKQIFRYDTFGDEDFWGGTLHLHDAIQGAAFGGKGAGVSPKTALSVGLKVDVDALPPDLVSKLQQRTVPLDSPSVTLALLQLNAVVGVKGIFSGNNLSSIGIQCAFCHSTVDNSFAPGIGHRLDGWANRDLNVGAIVNLSPDLSAVATLLGVDEATVRKVLLSWGPGKFDAELFMDGKAFQPNDSSAATLIPAAYGLAGVNLHTYTGWGSIPYWNAFVANLEMHGKGTFFDPRLDDATQFPIAAKNKFGHKHDDSDLITAKLPALHAYQLSLGSPKPPDSLFDHAAATRGDALFSGKAKCTTCHTDELYTEPGWNMHKGQEIGIDDFQANRSPDKAYRTTPLKGLWAHMKGGFYHDGRFATLLDVVDHYNSTFNLGLSSGEKQDLVEYMKSLGDVPVSITMTGVGQLTGTEPNRFVLRQNYPNPFNPSTVIQYELAKAGNMRLEIYSVTGELVQTLVSGQEQPGLHTITWNGRNAHGAQVATGVYLYRLQAGSLAESKKMLLMK